MSPLRSLLFLLVIAAMPVSASLFLVWVHQDAVQMGYTLSEMQGDLRTHRESVRALEVEYAAERSPERLMQMARRLGMRAPEPTQIIGYSKEETR